MGLYGATSRLHDQSIKGSFALPSQQSALQESVPVSIDDGCHYRKYFAQTIYTQFRRKGEDGQGSVEHFQDKSQVWQKC